MLENHKCEFKVVDRKFSTGGGGGGGVQVPGPFPCKFVR